MAAAVCLIFLIPYCAETKDDIDEDFKILNKKAGSDLHDNRKQDSDFELVKSQKSQAIMDGNRTNSDLFSHRSRFCIFPCLPVRSKSGIEEGKYCKEKEEQESSQIGNETNMNLLEKMSVI